MYVYFLNQKTTEMTVDTLKRVTFPRNTKNIIYIIYKKKKTMIAHKLYVQHIAKYYTIFFLLLHKFPYYYLSVTFYSAIHIIK